jgi:CIC family chloride channel protein
VIEGAALHDGRVDTRAGLASVAASLITLSSGGSTGREGPVVHMAAMISTWVCARIDADGITGRDLLGCAVAAAVSASFNAPIVIASAAGTVINRLEYGDVTEFALSGDTLGFYVELPAFLLLGLVCGLVAVAMMRAIWWADDLGSALQARTAMPPILRPVLAGGLLGAMAILFPHIIGVGYETTSRALLGELILVEAIVFAVVKAAAVAITMAGRMGGGVFSPSLMMGALTGLAFGLIATSVFPEVSGSETLYALAGMGAVAAAVLGAPISTTLIVFELTGDWQTGLAVMVSVSISSAVASNLVHRSFFLTSLYRRGVHLAAGPQAYLLGMFRVAQVMRANGAPRAASEAACWELIEEGVHLDAQATLEAAMPMFEKANLSFIPVVTLWSDGRPPELLGALFQVDALRAYNRALAATAAEEHS